MPEGHTIHRQARIQEQDLAGQSLRVSSPQGRFADGASVLDGLRLESVEAAGKHLFYDWTDGPLLHVHLGLVGKFRRHGADPPPPTPGTRLAMHGDEVTYYLSGPMVCELTDESGRRDVVETLGPDPLGEGANGPAPARIVERLQRTSVPIAQALLDQTVIAGLGNVFRAEVLFLTGIHPLLESREATVDQVEAIWAESVAQLRAGERSGKIITTVPSGVGRRRRRDIERGERTYVYKRAGEPCRRCGTEIERTELAGRKVWWCPSCQPL